MKKYYAGIGSRACPMDVLGRFSNMATYLENKGYTLRSGGADGADLAFEDGVLNSENKEIFLPWENFNDSDSPFFRVCGKALKMASDYHPYWDNLKQGAKKLHARNCYQILGKDLKTPVDFVCCWTENAELKGGTAQALRIAEDYDIKIFNFGKDFNLTSKELLLYLKHNE